MVTALATLGLLCETGTLSADASADAHWAQWRGPSGQGYSDDDRVPLRWSETENLLWKTDLPGYGNSTPIVWGDRIFLTAASNSGVSAKSKPRPDERYLLCLRASDGKLLWQRTVYKSDNLNPTHEWNGYASASCVTDGTHAYAFFGTPGLFCYDFDGNLVWKHTFGIFTTETGWGTGASPFLFEDLVIQNCDNDGAKALLPGRSANQAAPMALVALDKKTGRLRWQTPRNQGRGYSTPRLITTPEGRLDLVLNGPHGVWGYDPRTGQERWHCTRLSTNAAGKVDEMEKFGEPMPVSNREVLFAVSGRPGPFQAIRLGGTGDVTKTHLVWEVRRKGHRDVASPILWQDRIYAADRYGFLTCHDASTGKVIYNERIPGRGKALASPVAVRGKLLFLLDEGTTLVVEPGDTFKLAGSNKLGRSEELDFTASPAIADGRLYLRSQSRLYCIAERK
jgi:outer membrane protein assembly factor BamB